MQFYLFKNNQQLGPYSAEQIQVFIKQGLIALDDLVWANEWPSWIAICNVPGLAQAQSSFQDASVLPATKIKPPVSHTSVAQKNNIKTPTASDNSLEGDNSKVGTIYADDCRSFPKISGSLARSTIHAQACRVYITSDGYYAVEYARKGWFSPSKHVVVLFKHTIEVGRLPEAFIRSRWKHCMASASTSDIPLGHFTIPFIPLVYLFGWLSALSKGNLTKGVYLTFLSDERRLEEIVLLGDGQLIEKILLTSRARSSADMTDTSV